MKVDALVFLEKGKIGIQSIEIEEPSFDEVQIEMKACGICTGDLNQYKGITVDGIYPYGFGHEGVGIVIKTGPNVTTYRPGDKVACIYDPGVCQMAQVANVHMNRIAHIPNDISSFTEWILEPVACVTNSIHMLNLQMGDRIALVGAGFMGLLLAQGIAHTLAGELVVMDMDFDRLKLVPKSNNIKICCLGTEQGKKDLEKFLSEKDFDIAIEASGSASGLATAENLLKMAGKLQLFGWQRGMREFDGTRWHLNGWQICNASPFCNERYEALIPRTVRSMENHFFDLRPLITHSCDYHCADELFQLGVQRDDGYIKGAILF